MLTATDFKLNSLFRSLHNAISEEAIHCLAVTVADALCACLSFVNNSAAAATATAAAAPSAELDVRYSSKNLKLICASDLFMNLKHRY
jgi:hypothetical protein